MIPTPVKKTTTNVDNLLPREKKRYQLICQIQAFLKEGCSYREISKRMGVSRNTVAKYSAGDPLELSRYGINQSKLDAYKDEIFKCLHEGHSKSKTVKHLYSLGYRGAKSTAFDYLVKIERYESQNFAPQLYVRTRIEGMKYKTGSKGKHADYLTRAVASNLSNGFVEGTNNKLKMIKRTMYDRCGQKLLSAKMMLRNTT